MTNENSDVAEMQRREFNYKEIRSRINREHELISNRIGWLLTSNAFLVTPLVIYYNDTSKTGLFCYFPYIIAIFALILAILGCYTIGAAVETINVLKKRETVFMREKENTRFHLLDPDQDYKVPETQKESKDGYKRKNNTHKWSMICTRFIPGLVLVFWIVILGGDSLAQCYIVLASAHSTADLGPSEPRNPGRKSQRYGSPRGENSW